MIVYCQVEYAIAVHLVDEYEEQVKRTGPSIQDVADMKLAELNHSIEQIRIDELEDYPIPRNCHAIKDEPCNCPNDRARGPPGIIPLTERRAGFQSPAFIIKTHRYPASDSYALYLDWYDEHIKALRKPA